MTDGHTAREIAEELQEWITQDEAAKLHPSLSAEKIASWRKVGILQKGGSGIRIWLPGKYIGLRAYVRARDVSDFLDAMMPDAPKELVERFAQ